MSICPMSVQYGLVARLNIRIPEEQSGGFDNIPVLPKTVCGNIPEESKQKGPCDVCLSVLPGSKV